jgi:uncharacterized membrane protein YkoI
MTRFGMKQLLVVTFALVFAVAGVAIAKERGEKQEEKAQYHSSIQVPAAAGENESAEQNESGENNEQGEQNESAEKNESGENDEHGEAAEGAEKKDGDGAAQYQSLAKITKQQAITAASAKVAGKVMDAELENEDGNLVYGVEVKNGKGVFDVKVDAGNGAVLFVSQDTD